MYLYDCIYVCSLKGYGYDFSNKNFDIIVDNVLVWYF